MVPFRLRLEAERFKRGNYVFVPKLLRVLFTPRRCQDRCVSLLHGRAPRFVSFRDTLKLAKNVTTVSY